MDTDWALTLWTLTVLGITEPILGAFAVNGESAVRANTVFAPSYDPLTRPTATTDVKIGIRVNDINELDLRNQIYGVSGWMLLEWMDPRLVWDPSANGAIESVLASSDKIWTPTLAIDTTMDDRNNWAAENVNIKYDYKGRVFWQPRRSFQVFCQIEKHYFPFEEQKCVLVVVGWSYNVSEVTLGFISKPISTQLIRESDTFSVTKTENSSSHVEETLDDGTIVQYPKLEFWFSIKRNHRNEYNAFLLPVLVTTFLIALTFFIRSDTGERLSYTVNLYLSLTVLLTVMTEVVPPDFLRKSGVEGVLASSVFLSAQAIMLSVMLMQVCPKEDEDISESLTWGQRLVLSTAIIIAKCLPAICLPKTFRRERRSNRVRPWLVGDGLGSIDSISVVSVDSLTDRRRTLKESVNLVERFLFALYIIEIIVVTITLYIRMFGVHWPDQIDKRF